MDEILKILQQTTLNCSSRGSRIPLKDLAVRGQNWTSLKVSRERGNRKKTVATKERVFLNSCPDVVTCLVAWETLMVAEKPPH